MKQLASEEQFEELKQGHTVFEFTADWCPDCKVIEPDLPQLEEKYDQFQFVSVDRDQFIDLCIENDILGIPSFLIFKEGQLTGSYNEKERKSIEQIDQFLSKHV
ncbi:thioredoxin family protein [Staphylococcus saccharolyticus]|uniref:Thioredoxin-like protein n=1 Tax=Staphylococcus saccharolyticus TaxID=33028 RepID=A0A380H212_9STAP|nr:thioredoxin family protein [Staphylococcus saccharolyticus]MBL7565024.1 thioredoxin family protein [Staphylococcus saccharolyticus]MBL7571939.1 thioredoxin family protein [Staphylococcus saccharolyticus]QQB98423.1 thioredoxin family protein [Staphylococcus saccharolyticus]QRJ67362.1 thioredoxin family protein [Staphylococcus saccharolyticus]RTX97808.1 thioredoxin [Staphylococcus saccharolyticus]